MAFDTNRAAFVQNEHRYASAINTAVLSRNASARVVEITTQLDEASATQLANKLLAENNAPRAFEVTVEGVFSLSKLVGQCPSFLANFPKLAAVGRQLKLVGFTTSFERNETILQVRG